MEDALVRVMPHNKEAEQSIIGAMLVDKDSAIPVFESLSADDFYIEAHKNIFFAQQGCLTVMNLLILLLSQNHLRLTIS